MKPWRYSMMATPPERVRWYAAMRACAVCRAAKRRSDYCADHLGALVAIETAERAARAQP